MPVKQRMLKCQTLWHYKLVLTEYCLVRGQEGPCGLEWLGKASWGSTSLSKILKAPTALVSGENGSPIQDQFSFCDPSELLLLEFWSKIQATNQSFPVIRNTDNMLCCHHKASNSVFFVFFFIYYVWQIVVDLVLKIPSSCKISVISWKKKISWEEDRPRALGLARWAF